MTHTFQTGSIAWTSQLLSKYHPPHWGQPRRKPPHLAKKKPVKYHKVILIGSELDEGCAKWKASHTARGMEIKCEVGD
jgi:hypothetical protein